MLYPMACMYDIHILARLKHRWWQIINKTMAFLDSKLYSKMADGACHKCLFRNYNIEKIGTLNI